MNMEAVKGIAAKRWGLTFTACGMFVWAWALATPLVPAENTADDIGTRAMAGVLQPGQMPSFPQQFKIQGPMAASYAFAVTQPGPVLVDVQAQGSPVVITLENLGGPPMTQQGTGHVQLAYQVTPQDVQRSIFWIANISLALSGIPQGAVQATGTVMVRHPPVNEAVVQAQAAALVSQHAPSRFPNAQGQIGTHAAFEDFKLRFQQQQQQRQALARSKNQPILDRIHAAGGLVVQSRGLDGDSRAPGAPAISTQDEVGTRVVPPQRSLLPAASVPTAAPSIDCLNKILNPTTNREECPGQTQQGQPKDQVIIYGKNFGNTLAEVNFQIAQNITWKAVVVGWSDTMILVEVPDASGLLQFDGGIVVRVGQMQSNSVPFRFIPAQEVREIQDPAEATLAPAGSITRNPPAPPKVHHPNTTFATLGGGSGNDALFPTTKLTNGWIVQAVWAGPVTGCGGSLKSDPNMSGSPCGGAIIADQRLFTDNPYINVMWWYSAFQDSWYSISIGIAGPRGVPDGVVVR